MTRACIRVSVHNKEAAELGYELSTEEGNAGYAKYLS
jgi:hypothetical protein